MAPQPDIPDIDERAVNSVMKLGGKKKLDALISMLNDSAPLRLQELREARSAASAKAAARALKAVAASVGLARLEDLCDRVLAADTWTPGGAVEREAAEAFERGSKALAAHRKGL